MSASLLARLDAHDRALFARLLLAPYGSTRGRSQLIALTHLGGAPATIALALLPFVPSLRWTTLGRLALTSLVVSHLAVQLVKRTIGRPRPSRVTLAQALVVEPDRFSFPSGHAAAAMALAVSYAVTWPMLMVPLVALAVVIGATRVCLGVHYPGDVVAGQLLAIVTVAGLRMAGL
jgi:undecaprenyl-diphosphatase